MNRTDLEEFRGGDRFTIERRLGHGTFGVVYQAYDRQRRSVVALKTLRTPDATALYRMKQEFRSLADLAHPNLVSRHELLSAGEQWFITMELVEGVDLLSWIRGRPRSEPLATAADEAGATIGEGAGATEREAHGGPGREAEGDQRPAGSSDASSLRTLDSSVLDGSRQPTSGGGAPPRGASTSQERRATPIAMPPLGERPPTRANVERLRPALRQLAEGLQALHDAGKLHRDLKPSNVLVTPEGRVVILDFGMVLDLEPLWRDHSLVFAGTPTYMSPEQAAAEPVTEASDWYAVGVMLFEALTNRLPQSGDYSLMLRQKRDLEPPPPSRLVTGVPADLDRLCIELLRRDPAARPGGEEVLRRISDGPRRRPQRRHLHRRRRAATGEETPFIGRARQLAGLWEAFELARSGRAVTVHVHGSSGMGKTTLVHRFLADLAARRSDVAVLAGRCFEREMVPYKALDSLVDSLAAYLRNLPERQAAALLPRDVLVLGRLFPVLHRVRAVASAQRRVFDTSDSRELRRRGFAALRELFARLSAERPLVLFIDDLHWGDTDSAALLGELLSPPDPPALLLIVTYRSEEAETSPSLHALLGLAGGGAAAEVREIRVDELSPDESRDFVERIIGAENPGLVRRAASIVRESGGNPFFLNELLSYSMWQSSDASAAVEPLEEPTSLDQMIDLRMAGLPGHPRRLLDVLVVAGRPVPLAVASGAADLGEGALDAVTALHAARLVRTRTTRSGEELEPYHARIQEAVFERLDADQVRALHGCLAASYEAWPEADPESLAEHHLGAGEPERAAAYAEEAAVQAAEALAFNRAAQLFRLALETVPDDDPRRRRLRLQLADALVNAGRGTEAAEHYLNAAAGAEAAEAIELRRRAAQHLLMSGRLDEGRAVLRTVLSDLDMRPAPSPRRALLSILWRRAWLRLRGLRFRERREEEIAARQLLRIDTCWAVSVGMGLVDTIQGADFQARQLMLALRAGEPRRLARALSLEIAYRALPGSKSSERTEELVRLAGGLAKQVNEPRVIGLATMNTGIAAYLQGRWRRGFEYCDRAEKLFRERCTGVAWEIDTCQIFSLGCLLYMGDLDALAARVPGLLKDARERGDLFIEIYLVNEIQSRLLLAADRAGEARRRVDEAIGRWRYEGFHRQHHYALHARVESLLYERDGEAALRLVEERFPALERSLILRMQAARIRVFDYRGRSALAAALALPAREARRQTLLRAAEQDAARIAAERVGWGDALASLLRAGVTEARGDERGCIRLLAAAESLFEAAAMGLHEAAARRRRGALLGGGDGERLVREAERRMVAEGIAAARRFAWMLAPFGQP